MWEAQHDHPFVRGLGAGTVDRKKFERWLRQDYLFLVEYARLLALAAARAPDLDTMRRLADLLQATLGVEMDLHRSYVADFGITAQDLLAETMSPTTRAYTDFLLRTATLGDFAELVAALLPCMWGFSEIGRRLAARPRPADERYARWIDMYAAPEFAALADWCRALLDRVASGLPAEAAARVESAFLTSSRYEYLFWDMAEGGDEWPV
ncbi:MAG TPA: thiaminase II [Methylomirabilota bacterium]